MTDKKFMTKKDLEGELFGLRDRLCEIIEEYAVREREEGRSMVQGAIALGLGLIISSGASFALVVNEHPFIAAATLFGGTAGSVYGSYRLATRYLDEIERNQGGKEK
ncbi:MAG: hypothetical protein V2A62_02935 [Candidatus Woesearchaeota archaeon]